MSLFSRSIRHHGLRKNMFQQCMRRYEGSVAKDLRMTSLSMEESDKELFDLISKEQIRQKKCLNLSPLENYTSRATLDTIQTVLQNKYSEGYPRARYYGGNENVDDAEELCQSRALSLFNLSQDEWSVNVQSLSSAASHLEALTAMVSPNARVLTLDSRNGGDISLGGSNKSALQTFFNVMLYNTNKESGLIDYEKLSEMTNYIKPDMIMSGNGNNSGYPRMWDWKELKNICQTNSSGNEDILLMCDISDVAGLIATGHYPSPFEFCDIVTCAANTSLRGPKGAAIIFFRQKYAQQVNMAVFPGHQGGPHNHAISAMAASLLQATSDDFNNYQTRALENANELAIELEKKGYKLLTGGTDTTTVIIDKNQCEIDCGNCDSNNIHILFDNDSNTVRMSSLAMTTRGLNSNDFKIVADLFDQAANGKSDNLQDKVSQFVEKFPLPGVDVVN